MYNSNFLFLINLVNLTINKFCVKFRIAMLELFKAGFLIFDIYQIKRYIKEFY
jgi:hypothetical protein